MCRGGGDGGGEGGGCGGCGVDDAGKWRAVVVVVMVRMMQGSGGAGRWMDKYDCG